MSSANYNPCDTCYLLKAITFITSENMDFFSPQNGTAIATYCGTKKNMTYFTKDDN